MGQQTCKDHPEDVKEQREKTSAERRAERAARSAAHEAAKREKELEDLKQRAKKLGVRVVE